MTEFSKSINQKARTNYEEGKSEEQKRILNIILDEPYGEDENIYDFIERISVKIKGLEK